jgi:hypothetical protein
MPYRIAGIDVHKKMLAVVVSDLEVENEYQFDRRMFGSNPEQLRSPAAKPPPNRRPLWLPLDSAATAKPPEERTAPREFPFISVVCFLALLLIN